MTIKMTVEVKMTDKALREAMEQPGFSFTYFTGAGGPVTLYGKYKDAIYGKKDEDGFYSYGYPIDLTNNNVLFRFHSYDKMVESLCQNFEFTPNLYERLVDAFNSEKEIEETEIEL